MGGVAASAGRQDDTVSLSIQRDGRNDDLRLLQQPLLQLRMTEIAGGLGQAVSGPRPVRTQLPWWNNANDNGTFKSDNELNELHAEDQVDLARTPSPTAASVSAPR